MYGLSMYEILRDKRNSFISFRNGIGGSENFCTAIRLSFGILQTYRAELRGGQVGQLPGVPTYKGH
jgi:hypothetical protein